MKATAAPSTDAASQFIFDVDGELATSNQAPVGMGSLPSIGSDGVYETILCRDGAPVRLEEHLERLNSSVRYAGYAGYAADSTDYTPRIQALLRRRALTPGESKLRIVVYADGQRVHSTIGAWPVDATLRDRKRASGVSARIAPSRRMAGEERYCHKTLNLFETAQAARAAERHRAEEAIFLNDRGEVCEALYSNLYVVTRELELVTPPVQSPCLPGITRRFVQQLAERHSIACHERVLVVDELLDAAGIFLTSSVSGLVPVVSIQQRPVGDGMPHPIVRRLQDWLDDTSATS